MGQSHDAYPTEILPRIVYKKRLCINKLLDKYPDLLVVRMVEGVIEDYLMDFESGDVIFSEKVFKNSMANLSMNLAGGLFDTSSHGHLKFLPTNKEATKIWKGWKVPQKLYIEPDSYNIFYPCFGLCFYVVDIHERTFPFYKHFENVEERNVYAEQTAMSTLPKEKEYEADYVGAFESKKKNVLVRPRIKVHHSPSKVNYWHVTLDTYRPTDIHYVQPDEKQNSSDIKMFKALKQNLVQCCHVDESPSYQLNKRDYYHWFWYYLWTISIKLKVSI